MLGALLQVLLLAMQFKYAGLFLLIVVVWVVERELQREKMSGGKKNYPMSLFTFVNKEHPLNLFENTIQQQTMQKEFQSKETRFCKANKDTRLFTKKISAF